MVVGKPHALTGRLTGRNPTRPVEIDDYVFEPCGYSMNGVERGTFSTIHITPEDGELLFFCCGQGTCRCGQGSCLQEGQLHFLRRAAALSGKRSCVVREA